MKINLTGVHPNTYEGEVKSELSALQYPIEVTATKKFYIEEGDDEMYSKWVVYLPEDKDYTHAAWFLTDNEEINEWVIKHWNKWSSIHNS